MLTSPEGFYDESRSPEVGFQPFMFCRIVTLPILW